MLRPSEFRKVYDQGTKVTSPLFSAFLLKRERPATAQAEGPRVGFTVPRAIGKAVIRNRIRRRMREAMRQRLSSVSGDWDIVVNPRRAVESAEYTTIEREVERLLLRCAN